MYRLKPNQVAQAREELLEHQNKICPLCKRVITDAVLDHCHRTGYIRDVLCRNCNIIEGRIFSSLKKLAGNQDPLVWFSNFIQYHERHSTPQHGGVFHPTHRTPEEKRIKRNAKARKKRALAKTASPKPKRKGAT